MRILYYKPYKKPILHLVEILGLQRDPPWSPLTLSVFGYSIGLHLSLARLRVMAYRQAWRP